ncbi:MAG: 2-C-methyl-D-erythritol 4-phosphate cytidylyltransferase [Chloroflexi bacterium]|jgi:2-C-methyl-D-erythritol 4-phosphate cytidylyltransferase|nr:2-C-methyl-D-erythritol 4-phosphate cytidylyltransferase [Chloroflexota bacterium]
MTEERIGAIIVAAGKSERMNGIDKLFTLLDGKPLLAKVIEVFQECDSIDEIIVVLGQENLERTQQMTSQNGWSKVSSQCLGGARRQDSVNEGLKRLNNCQWVIIHDGARPLVTSDIIMKGLAEAHGIGAAVAAVPVKDTIKMTSEEGFVRDTPLRDNLWAVQTPQVFRSDLIIQAHSQITEEVTDDATMVEKLGHEVKLYMGSYQNIKITTPEDLALAEIILRNK